MTGSYAIYKDGWKASFPHDRTKRIPVGEEKWHLYHVREDYNELNDLAAKYPDKVKELADLFDAEAWKYNVYPLKTEWKTENLTAFGDTKKITLRPGNYFTRTNVFRFYSSSYTLTANVEIAQTGNQGVLFSFGNTLSGISFYIKDKKLVFAYNADGKLTELKSVKDVPAGKVALKADVNYSNEGKNKTITLYINGEQVATKDLGKISTISSGYEGLEVGRDVGTTVSPAYKAPFAFNGQLNEVIVDFSENKNTASKETK
jgi:hypothetical protein